MVILEKGETQASRPVATPAVACPSCESSVKGLVAGLSSVSASASPAASSVMLSDEQKEDLRDLLFRIAGIKTKIVHRNPAVSLLYEDALKYEDGTLITSMGALACRSGEKTGRCPKDKRIVDESDSRDDIWWGPVNIKCSEHVFDVNRERAVDFMNMRQRVYIFDGYAGWDPKYRIKVRVISARAYHCLFMHNMLIRPNADELRSFGTPDFTIINAGEFPANKYTESMSSQTTVSISFQRKEMVILGTQYAGEMKKGIFSVMHYLMPKQDVLSLHASCNVGMKNPEKDVTLFFGLSGTGKTTLSADIHRSLVGDDEHCWSDHGIFNIEGGCYAKCIDLSRQKEPEIYDAIRFGAVLENVVLDERSREIQFADRSITENTRVAYPIDFIPNSKVPCIAGHPKNLIMLTCDAFGILPPVSKLTLEQAMYHFISGYTAKIPGTEMGVTDPVPNFSACFGQPFIIFHPAKYAKMLADRMHAHSADAWLINTGWTGGKYGIGERCPLKYTRAILDAIHSGELAKVEYELSPVFNLHIPKTCPGVPQELLHPEKVWLPKNDMSYLEAVRKLAGMFQQNFLKYQDETSADVVAAGPRL